MRSEPWCDATFPYACLDYYFVDSRGNQKLVIQEHKTSDSTGTVVVPLTDVLVELVAFWGARTDRLVREKGHTLEKNYTMFVKKHFALIFGRSLTQQMLRRIFAKGLCHSLDCSVPMCYVNMHLSQNQQAI